MCYDPREATDYGQEYGGIIDDPIRKLLPFSYDYEESCKMLDSIKGINKSLPIEERAKYNNNEYPE